MTSRRIAFLGAGNMGRALIAGLLRSGTRPEQLAVGESSATVRAALERDFAITACADNETVIDQAGVVVLAVKPQEAGAVLRPLARALGAARPLLISVCAGTRVLDLEGWSGGTLAVVRAMPNRPALVGVGIAGMYAPLKVGASERAGAEEILKAVGEVVWVPTEDALDVVTALSGSGPAYFFLLAESLVEAGKQLGLEHQAAQRLAVATLYGSGLLAHGGDGDLNRLRKEVTSPGGTTEAALKVFESGGLRALVARAVAAATQRGRELAAQSRG